MGHIQDAGVLVKATLTLKGSVKENVREVIVHESSERRKKKDERIGYKAHSDRQGGKHASRQVRKKCLHYNQVIPN